MKRKAKQYTNKPEIVFALGALPKEGVPEVKLTYIKKDHPLFIKITTSQDVSNFIRSLYEEGTIELQEQFYVLYLNRANKIIGYYKHTVGGTAGTVFDMKLVLGTALKSLSHGIIVAHNHPSGNTKPSDADIQLTKKLKEAAKSMDISVLDHLIITKESYTSFADEGLLGTSATMKKNKKEASPNAKITEPMAREAAKELIRGYVLRGDTLQQLKDSHLGHAGGGFTANINKNKIYVTKVLDTKVDFSFPLPSIYNEILEEKKVTKVKPAPPQKQPAKNVKPSPIPTPKEKSKEAKPVERIEEEVRFIKRYALLHGKEKTDHQILNFINSLQKAILERRIRKTSAFAKEIQYIQENLVKLYNVMGKKVEIKVNKDVLEKFLTIGDSEKVRLSITYLKRYVGIQGKTLTIEKAQRLIDHMEKAVKQRKLVPSDPYKDRLNIAYDSLMEFVKVAKENDTLQVHQAILNGINEALDGCACNDCDDDNGLNGIEPLEAMPRANTVMNSMDFAKMEFDSLGFTGKWLELIGDPSEGFTAMVFGKPKMGKSYLCVDFAGYLARHHGNVLYVAKEEKLDATLQKKLNEKNVKHPNLYVSDYLPQNLSHYNFVFLDSVNKLLLSPEDLERLKANNPGISFIYIFQTTKEGNFRGANSFQHDVDVVIEVPEKGKAVQFGRFNQGGEMEIFEDYRIVA